MFEWSTVFWLVWLVVTHLFMLPVRNVWIYLYPIFFTQTIVCLIQSKITIMRWRRWWFFVCKIFIVQYLLRLKSTKQQEEEKEKKTNSFNSRSDTCNVHTVYLNFYFMIVRKLCRQLKIQWIETESRLWLSQPINTNTTVLNVNWFVWLQKCVCHYFICMHSHSVCVYMHMCAYVFIPTHTYTRTLIYVYCVCRLLKWIRVYARFSFTRSFVSYVSLVAFA